MRWQHGKCSAEDPVQTWDARGRDLARIKAAVTARQIWAAAEEAS